MDQQTTIKDIERRAKASRISIARLCREAGIHPVTFFRWKKSAKNPEPVGANFHSIEALYRELDKIDAEDTKRLLGRGTAVAA